MQKILWSLACLCICVCACATTTIHYTYTRRPANSITFKTVPIYIDANLGASDQVQIAEAIDSWNYALNEYVVLTIQSTTFDMSPKDLSDIEANGAVVILKIDSTSHLIPSSDDETMVDAFTYKHYIYLIRDRLVGDPNHVETTTMHELAHALFDLDHINNRMSLMYYLYTPAFEQCIDRYTIDEVAKVIGVPEENLNYCEYQQY